MSGDRQASDVWDVIVDPTGVDDIRAEIYSAFPDWQIGEESPRLPGYFCTGHQCDNWESSVRWRVSVTYAPAGGLVDINGSDPLQMLPQFSGDSEDYEEDLEVDADDDEVVTTAGEPMESGSVTRTMSDLAFVVTRNYPAIPNIVPFLRSFANKVNSDTFLGAAPGEVLIRGIPRLQFVYSQQDGTVTIPAHWQVSWRFVSRDPWPSGLTPPSNSAWYVRVRNQGYQILDSTDRRVGARDRDGNLYTRPQWIAADGQSVLDADTDTPIYLWFARFPAISFAPLGITSP